MVSYAWEPTVPKKLPAEALEFFRKQGTKRGKKSASQMTPEQRTERAKKAAEARWADKDSGRKGKLT